MEMFSPSKFRNEVIGVSDAGRRSDLSGRAQSALRGATHQPPTGPSNMDGITFTVGGVDWSGGGTTGVSRTVQWVWGWAPNEQKLRMLYFRIYPGNNPVQDVDAIVEVFTSYNVAMVVGDAGEGALPNSVLRDKLGHHRVFQVQYGSSQKPFIWNGVDRYLVDRTTMIDNYLMYLKRQGVVYGPYESMREPIADILNVYEEVTTHGKKVWRHSPSLPDDSLHAQLFAWLAFKIVMSDIKFYQ
jgi:hypothetical protein